MGENTETTNITLDHAIVIPNVSISSQDPEYLFSKVVQFGEEIFLLIV